MLVRSLNICLAIFILVLAHTPLRSQDSTTLQSIISRQMQAFQADDGNTAFEFASPNLQQMFQTPSRFMEMVKRGYAPVYRPESYQFGEMTSAPDGNPVQIVDIVDSAGNSWRATYQFERQPDGTWRIGAVSLEPLPGSNV
jgi:hypothetical protein